MRKNQYWIKLTRGKEMNFSVVNNKLTYGEKPLQECEEYGLYPFSRFVFDSTPLSEDGANGVIFSATHKLLDIRQAVKLWRPEKVSGGIERALLEVKKNASRKPGDVIARVNDAGVIKSPIETIFAVMELEEESVTLEYWLKERKKYLNSSECHEFTPNAYDDACTLANSLDVAVGLLISIGVLHQHEIIHGDLHPGNILISGESVNTNNPADLRSILAPGNLEPVRARIIDLGTSEAEGTSREIGEVREVNAIITDVGNILKPITRFLNVKLSDLLKICREDSSYQGLSVWKFGDSPVLPQELAGDLLRLIGVLNLVLGYADNREDTADPLALDGHELKDFNTFMNESNGDHIKAISANVLQSLSENRVSRGRLVNWPSVWEKICERWKCFSNFEVVSYQYAGVDFYLRSRARSEDRN